MTESNFITLSPTNSNEAPIHVRPERIDLIWDESNGDGTIVVGGIRYRTKDNSEAILKKIRQVQ